MTVKKLIKHEKEERKSLRARVEMFRGACVEITKSLNCLKPLSHRNY